MKNVEAINATPSCKLQLLLSRISLRVDRNLSNSIPFDMLQGILGVFIENDLHLFAQGPHSLKEIGNIVAHTGMAIPATVKSNFHACSNRVRVKSKPPIFLLAFSKLVQPTHVVTPPSRHLDRWAATPRS